MHRSSFEAELGDSHSAGYLSPDLKGPSAGKAMINGASVGRAAEEVCNLIMDRKKALRLTGGFEASHDALASSGRLMAVFGSVIQTSMLAMLHTWHGAVTLTDIGRTEANPVS
jgi:hypothetical protein